jgi:hypothetical protein
MFQLHKGHKENVAPNSMTSGIENNSKTINLDEYQDSKLNNSMQHI